MSIQFLKNQLFYNSVLKHKLKTEAKCKWITVDNSDGKYAEYCIYDTYSQAKWLALPDTFIIRIE